MSDLEKLFDKAEKYLQREKFDSALETFLEINKLQPGQEVVLTHLGDLSLKLNRAPESLQFHSQLAELYIKRNELSKAIATCRKILKPFPQDAGTLMKLGGLLERSQRPIEALEAYREALGAHRKAGVAPQTLDCLQRIVRLDPNNVEAHVELAEEAARAHQAKLAAPAFLRAAQLARQAGNESRWSGLVERAYALDAGNESVRLAAAEVFLKKERAAEAITLLEPMIQAKPDDLDILELLCRAYLAARQIQKAEPLCFKLFRARPESADILLKLAEGLVATGKPGEAIRLLRQVKGPLFQQDKRNEFLTVVEKTYATDESNLEVLEMLSGLYNELNREEGLHRSLVRLFNLYLAGEQYQKAGETLERQIDVDPYGHGHSDRLLNLEGHIDKVWYENIASRIEPLAGSRVSSGMVGEPGGATPEKAEILDDLIIEGEMYHQYQLASKLTETLEKINRLYPGAQETEPRLRELYESAGFAPAPARPAGQASRGATPAARASEGRAVAVSRESLEDLKKISEITANIYRESTGQGVMQVAVNEIGRALGASRCWGALGAPGRPPLLTVEYCAPAVPVSDIAATLKLHAALIGEAANKPDGWSVEDLTRFPVLGPVLSEIQKLGIKSILALPLMDREQPAGLLLVQQCNQRRAWSASENIFVSSIATQVVTAVNNSKLRRLVRSLAGSDEQTGLLPRSSYLDCLLAEGERAREQSQPLSVCLLEPDNPAAVIKTMGEAAVQRLFHQVARVLQSNLRQNDIAIRYRPCSIAVVFPDTALPQGGLAVEKLQRVLADVKVDGMASPKFCAAVCDMQLGPKFDSVDGVTELINRLEEALEKARKEGARKVLLSRFEG